MDGNEERARLQQQLERELNPLRDEIGRKGGLELSPGDSRRIRDIAYRIVDGDIPRKDLGKDLARVENEERDRVYAMVQQIIALRYRVTASLDEERNPYFDPLSSRLVRDGETTD